VLGTHTRTSSAAATATTPKAALKPGKGPKKYAVGVRIWAYFRVLKRPFYLHRLRGVIWLPRGYFASGQGLIGIWRGFTITLKPPLLEGLLRAAQAPRSVRPSLIPSSSFAALHASPLPGSSVGRGRGGTAGLRAIFKLRLYPEDRKKTLDGTPRRESIAPRFSFCSTRRACSWPR